MLESIRRDLRYAIRVIHQNPGFAAVAVLSLALGIGANTAIFTLIDAVLLRSLPVRAPEQLVLFALNPDRPLPFVSYPDYEYIRDHNRSFSSVIAYGKYFAPVAFSIPSEGPLAVAEPAATNFVSGNYFDALGVIPVVGRVLTPADNIREDGHPWVVLDYDFWQRRFGGDPRAVGEKVRLNNSVFTVVGVARRGFTGLEVGSHPDLYVPIMMLREATGTDSKWNQRNFWWLTILARLKPGVTAPAAIPEMNVLWKQILAGDPQQRNVPEYDKKNFEQRNRATLLPGGGGYSLLRNQIEKPLTVLMVVVALVLLIACANVANLLLARAASRQREIAIRLAVGAGRWRLVRQLVVETLILSLAGGLAGLGLAWWGVRVLLRFLPTRNGFENRLDLNLDWRLLAFSIGVSLAVGVICGIVPALQATRPDLTGMLKSEAPTIGPVRFDLRRALVAAQVAISLLLLIGAGLFVRSLENLRALDPGFARDRVLLVKALPEQVGYKGQRFRDFYENLLRRVRAEADVRAAALAVITPLGGMRMTQNVAVEDYQRPPDEKPYAGFNAVTPGYFAATGIPLLAGRDFRPEDDPPFTPEAKATGGLPADVDFGPPQRVTIVSQAFATHYFPSQSPLGMHFTLGKEPDPAKSFEIVGVVKDAKYYGIRQPVEPMVYIPMWRFAAPGATLCVRTSGPPERLMSVMRREVAKLDPAVPLFQMVTMEDQFDNNISQERTVTTLCGFFGIVAVLLAAIGLYGVMAHAVTRRFREIGIRMALGARRGAVLWVVLRDTVLMIGIGGLIGLPAAFALTRLVQSFLFGLTPQDPLSIALATAALILVTGIAGYIPARRATRVDPMVALRYE